MKIIRSRTGAMLLCAGALGLIALSVSIPTNAQQAKQAKAGASRYVSPPGYITGVVQGEKGPEAGVWVIAETKDLQTGFIKTVVTNDQGRFMLPELPGANYKVWVRGYGLVDSTPVDAKPSATALTLKVTSAKTPAEAAKVYPGDYWLSMLAPPPPSAFPQTAQAAARMVDQDHWIDQLKKGCNFCHQLGNPLTRDVQHVFAAKPDLVKTHLDAWEWRLGVGVRGTNMYGTMNGMGKDITLKALADWTESIEKGALPPVPPRPSGIERNIVSTQWDVGDDHSFMHDEISTDKNHPNLNGGGPVYAVNAGHGALVVLDQADNNQFSMDIPTRDSKDKVPSRFPAPNRPSFFWGNEHLWSNPPYNPADPHNPMMDSKGRVWITSKIRGNQEPAWCSDPSNKYAEWFPRRNSARQASVYDPKTKKFSLIETCYATHHVVIDNDPDETVYFNELSGPVFGWIDSKVYDQTMAATNGDESKSEQAAVGWCEQTVDTNGDGKITRPWNVIGRGADLAALYGTDTAGAAPAAGRAGKDGKGKGAAAPFDPKLDTLVSFSLYSVMPSPVDDSVWGVAEDFPGYLIRLQRGANPPVSCKTQVFKVPSPGYDPRGIDVDSKGVVWTGLAATSHLASFDVRKCKNLTGTMHVDGSDCPEGWTLYQTPGPKLKGTNVPADFHYFNWTDSHNIMQMGQDTPFLTGSNSDSLIGLDMASKKWTYFRIPYPLGFYARGMDGRIDDANAGWKGRALYSNYGTHFVWHIEGGKGAKGKVVKFQLRPDPLAR
ncbi:MAG TPA: carboxypeptidase-like regulatory domain-containing protein [Bryobacteraceae bacterium]|nr:carboxypeptidase-like regulatory domain-containing protein [Bryobacteraceae bacterium]